MKKKQKKKAGLTTILLLLIFLAGLSLLLYPTVSNWWNMQYQSSAIDGYDQSIVDLDSEQYEELWAEAHAYNERLHSGEVRNASEEEIQAEYNSLLNVSGTGVMGYVEIPSINCKLPIYHGTDEAVLQVAIGHLEWTSLPVGGESTHSAISGHRGLPSAELLTHIDRLQPGDTFSVHVLGEELEYRVCDIFVVLPEDSSKLQVVEGKDYMTLVTCTPYGINSHRLLVRGERVTDDVGGRGTLYVKNEVKEVHLMYVIPVVLVVIVLAAAAFFWIQEKRAAYQRMVIRKRRERRAERNGEKQWSNELEEN